jgi:Type I restriction modification DNA specificity domain
MFGEPSPGVDLVPWDLAPLKYLLNGVDQGVSPQAEARLADEPGSWGVLKSGCVNYGKFRQEEHKRLPADFLVDKSDVVARGDIIVSRASGSLDLVGSAAMVNKVGYNLILSDKLFRLRPAKDTDAQYLVWLLNSRWYRTQVRQAISGAEGLANNLPLSALRAFQMPLPSTDEQRRIADFLDHETTKIDVLIAKQEQLVSLLRERRAALLDRHFQSVDGRRRATIRQVLAKQARPAIPGLGVITAYRDGVVTLRSKRREDGYTFSEAEHGYQEVAPGDLVFHALDGFAGAVGVSDSHGNCTPVYHVCRPRGNSRADYLALLIRYLGTSGFLALQAPNVRQRSVDFRNWTNFARVPLMVPSLDDQSAFMNRYKERSAAVEITVAKAEEFIALARERRAALITEAVTGRIDLSTGKAREGA